MTEGLLRQRRNLFITCALLWLMKYGGISFTKMALAGFDVEFAKPEVLTLALWLAYTYFLYRYYQYFSAEGIDKLRSVFAQALNEKCKPIIRRLVKAAHPEANDAVLYEYQTLKGNSWVYKGEAFVRDQNGNATRNDPFKLPIPPWDLRSGIARAVVESTFRSSVVTDYLLPFAVAAFVLWYCGAANWPGSFLLLLFSE